ncbi:uncharacterized protein H6S33_009054 [Morchella sextelata]|uniref:uncharacterized protein n=1 Tax=Morchella sextelata TaxID=1174677 RepID=UPI001D04EA72|nr:uncharacterized protein H6S33_009054 [Morchella sextelata]KAH0612674.1 hypothetical protein H6S33_009054 [Morchella sextelata]
MFSTLISPLPLPRSRTPNPYLNSFVPGNGTTATTSEFESSPLQPSTHSLQEFDLSANNNEKRKYNQTFAVSEDEDPLAEVAVEAKAEEEFFRNMYTYLDECEKNKTTSFQLLLFVNSMQKGGTLAMPAIQRGLSRMIGFFGGVVTGEWLLRAAKKGDSHLDGGVELDELEESEEEIHEK